MPVSVVVGGQYGSEGKGKVALHIAASSAAAAVVRVGGTNSGHTGTNAVGESMVFRQLPASSLCENALVILPAGCLIDPAILKSEITTSGLDPVRLLVDERASIITPKHRIAEQTSGLVDTIGSTGSGTGAALKDRMSRTSEHTLARDDPFVSQFTRPSTTDVLRRILDRRGRIVIEGTQGFGLSLWHGSAYPFATSRDTTAAGFVSETGLAPHDVDDVTLVIRSFPIRVGGNSGPLANEIDWATLANEAGLPAGYVEFTSATKRVRRVGRFHPAVVRASILTNRPHRIVLNHVDYVDPLASEKVPTHHSAKFILSVEESIDHAIDLIGVSPSTLIPRGTFHMAQRAMNAS